MNAIVSGTTVASLVIHALLGCCCHHAHGEMAGLKSATEAVRSICGHTHKCGESATEGSTPVPAKPSKQCQGVCVYLTTHKTVDEAGAVLTPLDLPAVLVAVDDSGLSHGPGWKRNCERGNSAPPLRLHLLHQILLI